MNCSRETNFPGSTFFSSSGLGSESSRALSGDISVEFLLEVLVEEFLEQFPGVVSVGLSVGPSLAMVQGEVCGDVPSS